MTRSELVARIASRFPPLTVKDAEAAVSTILSAIANTLASGNRAEIRGFGTFAVNHRPPKIGRNPRTGAPVSVPAKRVPHFKPGMELRVRVAISATGVKPSAGKSRRLGAVAELRPLV